MQASIFFLNLSYLQNNGYTSHVQLIKDGSAYTDLHKSYDTLGKTVLIQLTKSQTVWVHLVKSSWYAVYGSEVINTQHCWISYFLPIYTEKQRVTNNINAS